MKWSITQLRKHQDSPLPFETDMAFPHLIKNLDLIDLSTIHVTGELSMHYEDVLANVHITGHSVMACARTLEPVMVPIDITSLEIFKLNDYDTELDINEHEVVGGVIDLQPVIQELLVLNQPVRVVKEDGEFPISEGKDWIVVDEDQELMDDTPKVDPRLAKLKDLL